MGQLATPLPKRDVCQHDQLAVQKAYLQSSFVHCGSPLLIKVLHMLAVIVKPT